MTVNGMISGSLDDSAACAVPDIVIRAANAAMHGANERVDV